MELARSLINLRAAEGGTRRAGAAGASEPRSHRGPRGERGGGGGGSACSHAAPLVVVVDLFGFLEGAKPPPAGGGRGAPGKASEIVSEWSAAGG